MPFRGSGGVLAQFISTWFSGIYSRIYRNFFASGGPSGDAGPLINGLLPIVGCAILGREGCLWSFWWPTISTQKKAGGIQKKKMHSVHHFRIALLKKKRTKVSEV